MDDLIAKYIKDSYKTRTLLQGKLFQLFVETTGYPPHDICLVEQQYKKDDGNGYTTVFYFDIKSKYPDKKD